MLCAHRRGWDGVEWVNRQIEAALAAAGLIRDDGHLYVGQPIIVTRNDYQLGLFNGDVGLIVRDPERADARVAFFIAPDGTPRTLSPARLPPHETVFAMSVHKSQGSEFDEVAVLLPQQVSPVVSRELLYTAVTRARHRVTIHASREIVAHAITHRIERASGLREMLWRVRDTAANTDHGTGALRLPRQTLQAQRPAATEVLGEAATPYGLGVPTLSCRQR